MQLKPDYVAAIKEIENLHGNLAVLSRLNEILRDYNSNLADAEQLILSDGALASSVIKISNSVMYGRGKTHTNLHAAIQQVGFSQVLKLVGMALSKQVFMKDLTAYGITANQYWFSSYFTALFMEYQAKALSMGANDAYLIGLLHGIGKVVINELLRDRDVEIFWDPSIPSEAWEMVMIGFTHAKVGALLLDTWNFPSRIHEAINRQHLPNAKKEQPLLSMLDFASAIATRNTIEQPLKEWKINFNHPHLIQHNFSRDNVMAQIEAVIRTVNSVRKTLENL